jgi:hypothetical protein
MNASAFQAGVEPWLGPDPAQPVELAYLHAQGVYGRRDTQTLVLDWAEQAERNSMRLPSSLGLWR